MLFASRLKSIVYRRFIAVVRGCCRHRVTVVLAAAFAAKPDIIPSNRSPAVMREISRKTAKNSSKYNAEIGYDSSRDLSYLTDTSRSSKYNGGDECVACRPPGGAAVESKHDETNARGKQTNFVSIACTIDTRRCDQGTRSGRRRADGVRTRCAARGPRSV